MQYTYTQPKALRKNGDDDEDEKISFPFLDAQRKPYKQYDQTFTCQHVHFYISEGIEEPSKYTDMIHRIAAAGPADVIFLHLNTPGGQIDTGVQIINAMQNSPAKIVTILEGVAYSLGTLIFLAGDEMIVNDNCMMMFHNFNGGLIGKGNEMTLQLDATVKWFQSLAKNIYVPFLNDDELARIVRGEDLWMQTPEIRQRLEHMVKTMHEEQEQALREEEKAARAAERAEKAEKPKSTRGRKKKEPSAES